MNVRIPKLSAAQKKEIAKEARYQVNRLMPLVVQNVEAIILWQLHEQYGFGVKRLKRFFESTAPMITGMLEEYNFKTDEDAIWVCKYKLREIGIDLDALDGPFKASVEIK